MSSLRGATQQKQAPSPSLSRRAYGRHCIATSWEEIWEAGNYYDRISELMEDARESIVIVGWQIDSRLPLTLPMKRPRRGPVSPFPAYETLKQKLIRLCEEMPELHVYILMWDHAWFYIYEREVWQGRIWENIHPRIHFVFDSRHPLGASHHEKLCIIDGRVALCGGIDLCDERWDSRAHLHHDDRRSLDHRHEHHGPYHDLAVQVTGPVCQELHRHVAERWRRLSAYPFPPEPRSDDHAEGHSVYVSRTLSRIDVERGQPHVVREIEFLFRELVERAQKRIVLEGQYYWSEEFNDLLIRKIRQMRGKDFEIVLILADLRRVKSLTRVMSQYELRLLDKLQKAARFWGAKVFIGMPYSYSKSEHPSAPRPVYVHSKIMIVDDRYLSIGSANFAARAFRLDSEIHLTYEAHTHSERRHISRFAEKLISHWHTHAVELRSLTPALLLHHERGSHHWLDPPAPNFTWIDWRRYFDPEMSPLYPLKRLVSRLKVDKSPELRAVTKSLMTLFSATVAVYITNLQGPFSPNQREFAYATLLCSAWVLPIPFIPIAFFAVLDAKIPLLQAVGLCVASFWLVAALGYFGTRMFPTRAQKIYDSITDPRTNATLTRMLGERFFPKFLLASFDPAIPLHYKIAYEGLYCMPLPWFALTNGLMIPSALYGILSAWRWAWFAFAPQRVFQIISETDGPRWLAILVLCAAGVWQLSRESDAEKTQSSLVQHP